MCFLDSELCLTECKCNIKSTIVIFIEPFLCKSLGVLWDIKSDFMILQEAVSLFQLVHFLKIQKSAWCYQFKHIVIATLKITLCDKIIWNQWGLHTFFCHCTSKMKCHVYATSFICHFYSMFLHLAQDLLWQKQEGWHCILFIGKF